MPHLVCFVCLSPIGRLIFVELHCDWDRDFPMRKSPLRERREGKSRLERKDRAKVAARAARNDQSFRKLTPTLFLFLYSEGSRRLSVK